MKIIKGFITVEEERAEADRLMKEKIFAGGKTPGEIFGVETTDENSKIGNWEVKKP